MKFLYLANIRFPTEKAHGLQIAHMCEAFVQAGADLTLLVPRRNNTPEMKGITDPWSYYGVQRNFAVRRIMCLDLFSIGRGFERFAFPIQTLTYTLVLAVILLFRNADVYYSRDIFTLLVVSIIKPRRKLFYEAHNISKSPIGGLLQGRCARRCAAVFAVTGKLAEELRRPGGTQVIVAHDGFQIARFANVPDVHNARATLNLPSDAFIVGYSGRLHTMGLSKGIDTLIDAIAALPDLPITLCLVGGPAEIADSLSGRWLKEELPSERFVFAGHVAPSLVPVYISAFDVCAMPSPNNAFFAYYASPLKLFEYMAVGKPILSSDHPAIAEVIHNDESALLVPPEGVSALSSALRRLYEDATLRERLGKAAKAAANEYSWQARAERILKTIRESVSRER